jgi:hypothetical protein
MSMIEDFANLIDLGKSLSSGKTTVEDLVEEAAQSVGLADKGDVVDMPAEKPVLRLVGRRDNGVACDTIPAPAPVEAIDPQ